MDDQTERRVDRAQIHKSTKHFKKKTQMKTAQPAIRFASPKRIHVNLDLGYIEHTLSTSCYNFHLCQ